MKNKCLVQLMELRATRLPPEARRRRRRVPRLPSRGAGGALPGAGDQSDGPPGAGAFCGHSRCGESAEHECPYPKWLECSVQPCPLQGD